MAAIISSFSVSENDDRAVAVITIPDGEDIYGDPALHEVSSGSEPYVGDMTCDNPTGTDDVYKLEWFGATAGTTYRVKVHTVEYHTQTADATAS